MVLPEQATQRDTVGTPVWRDEMLRQSGSGDREAFAQLYDDLAPAVLALARRLSPDVATAADISHDAFVALWRESPGFDPVQGSATVWMVVETCHQARRRLGSLGTVGSLEHPRHRDRGAAAHLAH